MLNACTPSFAETEYISLLLILSEPMKFKFGLSSSLSLCIVCCLARLELSWITSGAFCTLCFQLSKWGSGDTSFDLWPRKGFREPRKKSQKKRARRKWIKSRPMTNFRAWNWDLLSHFIEQKSRSLSRLAQFENINSLVRKWVPARFPVFASIFRTV